MVLFSGPGVTAHSPEGREGRDRCPKEEVYCPVLGRLGQPGNYVAVGCYIVPGKGGEEEQGAG